MAHKVKVANETGVRESAHSDAHQADGDALRQEIQLRAYYRYCERGYAPGADVNDWVAAEQDVLAARAEAAPSAAKASAADRRGPRARR
jgi:hypothetical protein